MVGKWVAELCGTASFVIFWVVIIGGVTLPSGWPIALINVSMHLGDIASNAAQFSLVGGVVMAVLLGFFRKDDSDVIKIFTPIGSSMLGFAIAVFCFTFPFLFVGDEFFNRSGVVWKIYALVLSGKLWFSLYLSLFFSVGGFGAYRVVRWMLVGSKFNTCK